MSMISFATIQQTLNIRALWKEVFNDSDVFLDLYFNSIFKPEQCVVSLEEGELCAAMQLLPYTFQQDEKQFKAIYIYAVMTASSKRKQGHMSRMLHFAFDELCRQNVDFVFLIPQRKELFTMYEIYGFKPAFVQGKMELELPQSNDVVHSPDIEEAYAFYLKANQHKTAIIQSDKQFLFLVRSLRAEGGELLGVKIKGELSAICFTLPTNKGLRVLDVISLSDEATQKFLAALRNKYLVNTALISSDILPRNEIIGMAKILQPERVNPSILTKTYLSLMLNE